MTVDDQSSDFSAVSPSSQLLNDRYRIPIERLISEHRSKAWAVRDFKDMDEFASHPAAVLSDGDYAVFAKLSEARHGLDQFRVELDGLRLLADLSGVLTPSAIGIVEVEGGVILVMEAAQTVARTPHHWQDIGRTLACIHHVRGDTCGLEKQGYFGPLYQDNRPVNDWLTFFIERRLWPRFIGAIDSGNLPAKTIRQIERLITRLPRLSIPEGPITLLHGDAQQNNFISTEKGTIVIDPAVYYGNPEMDLAAIDYFQPVPEDMLKGYQELMPIDPGFGDRRDLWRIPGYLAAVEVEGDSYLPKLSEAIRKYL